MGPWGYTLTQVPHSNPSYKARDYDRRGSRIRWRIHLQLRMDEHQALVVVLGSDMDCRCPGRLHPSAAGDSKSNSRVLKCCALHCVLPVRDRVLDGGTAAYLGILRAGRCVHRVLPRWCRRGTSLLCFRPVASRFSVS